MAGVVGVLRDRVAAVVSFKKTETLTLFKWDRLAAWDVYARPRSIIVSYCALTDGRRFYEFLGPIEEGTNY